MTNVPHVPIVEVTHPPLDERLTPGGWTQEILDTAIGKPFEVINGPCIGKVIKATLNDDRSATFGIELYTLVELFQPIRPPGTISPAISRMAVASRGTIG